jgi:hypothetical protein
MSNGIRLFISHSAADADLATGLIALLRTALNLPAQAIRCTSVDGYRLQGGADTNEQLRREVHDAEAFIGIVSAASLRSLYVLFELGARWGAKKHLIPVLSPGTPASILGGPLAGLNALRADNRSQLLQLVTDLGRVLSIAPEGPAGYENHVSRILELPLPSESAKTTTSAITPKGLAPMLSVVAYEGSEAILFVQNTGGDGVFSADAQIIKSDSGSIGHPAPYRMRWRDVSTHEVVESHAHRIVSDGRAKLLLAEWESGGDWGKPSMALIGDQWIVDSYRHEPWEKRSPSVTIEVTINSVPPQAESFRRRYSLYIPPKTISKVTVVEDPPVEDMQKTGTVAVAGNQSVKATDYSLGAGGYSTHKRSRQRGSAHLQVGESSVSVSIAKVSPLRCELTWDPRPPFRAQFNADGTAVVVSRRNPHESARGEVVDFEIVEELD